MQRRVNRFVFLGKKIRIPTRGWAVQRARGGRQKRESTLLSGQPRRSAIEMKEYPKAALKTYGMACLLFMGIPLTILAATQARADAVRMLLWFLDVFAFVVAASILAGILNQRMERKSWTIVHAESIFVLLAAAIGGALPALWSESSDDFITMGGWIVFYGLLPALIAGIFHYGCIETIMDKRNAEQTVPVHGGERTALNNASTSVPALPEHERSAD